MLLDPSESIGYSFDMIWSRCRTASSFDNLTEEDGQTLPQRETASMGECKTALIHKEREHGFLVLHT